MAFFYLMPIVGRGTTDDPRRPLGVDRLSDWSMIDFSAFCFVSTNKRLKAGVYLGDEPSESFGYRLRGRVLRELRGPVRSNSVVDILKEFLLDHTGRFSWKPLTRTLTGIEIALGERLWIAPSVRGGVSIAEDWGCADSTSLNCDLTWNEIYNDFELSTNQARTVTADDNCLARAETDLSVNHEAQAVIGASTEAVPARGGTLTRVGVGVDLDCYWGNADFFTDQVRLFKFVAGVASVITSVSQTIDTPNTYTVKTRSDGSTQKVFLDGVEKISVTDTDLPTQLRTGIAGRKDTSGYISFDDFFAQDLGSAGVLKRPTQIRSHRALVSPSRINKPIGENHVGT